MNGFFSSRNIKKIELTLVEPVILFSVLFLPGYISQGMQEFVPDLFDNAWFNLFYIITTVPQIALILYVIILKPGRKPADFELYSFRKTDIPRAFLTTAGIYGCVIPLVLAASFIEPDLENTLIYGTAWEFNRIRLIPLVLLSCLITGYIEEIFFRSYLVKSLQNAGTALVPSVAVSTLLFAAGHLYEGLFAFIMTAVIGVFLSFVYHKTKSIHAISIGHGLYNFSVLILSMVGES